MKKLLLGFLTVLMASFFVIADEVVLKPDSPQVYIVKKGDTLWDISEMYLDNPWFWPEIWHVNPHIKNPHLIYPGDELSLIMVNGQKKVTVTDRAPVEVPADDGIVHLTPEVRTSPLEDAIPAIPLEKIAAFLSKSRVVDSMDELNGAPYVIAGTSKRIISGAGDEFYARGDFDPDEKIFGIYRAGDVYKDPQTGEILGIQALDIGSGRVLALNEDVATLIINRSTQEIRVNDRLLPSEEKKVTATFYPKAPDTSVRGVIIGVENGVSNVGTLSVVALNVGERDGLVEGDVLKIEQSGEVVRDRVKDELVQLPNLDAGLLIVFRTFEKMSFGLVVRASLPLSVGDQVSNP